MQSHKLTRPINVTLCHCKSIADNANNCFIFWGDMKRVVAIIAKIKIEFFQAI